MNVSEEVIGKRRIPDLTRKQILESAFQEFYHKGYQAASVNAVLADTGLTKGALYHHFKNKKELALAVIEEGIAPFIRSHWENDDINENVAARLQKTFSGILTGVSEKELMLGCPLNNLIQEMSPVDEDFRRVLNDIVQEWRDVTAKHLKFGQENGQIRSDIDPVAVATFIVSSVEGTIGTTKASRDPMWALISMKTLCEYIGTLAVQPQSEPLNYEVE